MRPLRVWARNLRTYTDVDVDLPAGVAAIVGPNGAGKSTIASLVDWALFADGGRDLAPLLSVGETELELGCEFEHDGDVYRVRRTYTSRGGGKATLDVEECSPLPMGGWQPLTRATTKETQAALEQLLGLNRQTFQASAFCGQGAGDRFAAASPKERKQVLSEILALGQWALLETRAKDDRRAVELEQSQAQARASMLEPVAGELDQRTRDVDALEQQETQVAEEVSLAEALVAETVERQQDAQAAAARVFQARAEQATARAAFELLDRARADAAEAEQQLVPTRERIAELEPVAAGGPQLQAERAELDRALTEWFETKHARAAELARAAQITENRATLQAEIDRLAAAAIDARMKAEALDGEGDETCDRCGQELHAEARERARSSYIAEAAAAHSQADAHADELRRYEDPETIRLAAPNHGPEPSVGDLEQREHDCRAAQVELASLRERAATLEQRYRAVPAGTALAEAQVALTAADDTLAALLADGTPDLEELAREHRARSGRLQTEQARLSETRAEIAVARERVTKAAEAAADLAIAREQLDTTADRLDLLRLAQRAYGRDGIPLLVTENAIPQLEAEVNALLGRLATIRGTFRVELITQRELKTRDGLQDGLWIMVDAPHGRFEKEQLSGGEQLIVDFALRIGLSRLLEQRAGASIECLVLDEPDIGLREPVLSAFPDILEWLAGEFDLVLLIPDHDQLAAACQTVIRVDVGDDGRSTISQGDREPVPA